MSETITDWQVWRDSGVAGTFVEERRACIPGAEAQFETMLRLLRYVRAQPLVVLDLGCGDGIVLETVLCAYPNARGVAVDGSAAMLEKAQERFARYQSAYRVAFVEADFNDPGWVERLPLRRFDAVVSAFAIHHSEDPRKRALYAETHDLLNPGGLFVNIEHVGSASSLGEELFERNYAEALARLRRGRGEAVTDEAVYQELTTRSDKAANRLAPVETQLQWLREIGFRDVDCYWKQYELAVLAGFRSRP